MESSNSVKIAKDLEELSKPELINKCKGLLNLAKKAKEVKDLVIEENKQLIKRLEQCSFEENRKLEDLNEEKGSTFIGQHGNVLSKSSTRELEKRIETYLEEIKIQNEKLEQLDNENVSYKRQVSRLSDENEQLITHLESLEKQIEELKKIGTQQQHQLLELERNNKLLEESNKSQSDTLKVTELQNMLSISLGEVKKLQSENAKFSKRIEYLEQTMVEKDKAIMTAVGELKLKCDIVNSQKQKLDILDAYKKETESIYDEYNKLKLKYEDFDRDTKNDQQTLNNLENLTELSDVNERLKTKVKLYHSKIVKFASHAKNLKDDKNEILRLFKSYTNQVKEWKEQLNSASQQLISYVHELEGEKHLLVQENQQLSENYKKLSQVCEEEKSDRESNLIKQNKKLLDDIANYFKVQEDYLNKIHSLETEQETFNMKLSKTIAVYEEKIKLTMNEHNEELNELHKNNLINKINADHLTKQNGELKLKIQDLVAENHSLVENFKQCDKKVTTDFEVTLKKMCESHNNILEDCKEKSKFEIEELRAKIDQYKETEFEMKNLKEKLSSLQAELDHSKATEQQLAAKSSEEILKLLQENKDLTCFNNELHEKLNKLEKSETKLSSCKAQDDMVYSSELGEPKITLKHENSELLAEMNEMNQVLKERGETISKLESHCDEIMKKLQIYETQANRNVDNIQQKEEEIKNLTMQIQELKHTGSGDNNSSDIPRDEEIMQLRNEIEILKERLSSSIELNYAESETTSTSTISRAEELNRLKDLDGSWEERYGKLRKLAVKLKNKVKELTTELTKEQSEKVDIQQKMTNSVKNLQALQQQCDKLEDDLDKEKKLTNEYLSKLHLVAEDISKDKQLIVAHDEVITKLKLEIEDFKKEKQTTDIWKKQVSAKVQTLRKELEAKNMLKKEYDCKISELMSDIETKEQALKSEIESHKLTKSLLEQSNNECKKKSVLNLEMQDYERSVKDLSQKLDKKQEQITKLLSQVDSQKGTINALTEQNKLLDERIKNEETDLSAASSEITSFKKKISELEDIISQKEEKINDLAQLLETARSENEELCTELSKAIAEQQKVTSALKGEKEILRSQNIGLHQTLREVQDKLKLAEDQLKIIHGEYESYKVRAQSVLRQNQSRDIGLEEKLVEETTTLKALNFSLNNELEQLKEKQIEVEKINAKLNSEKEEVKRKFEECEQELEEIKQEFELLSNKYHKAITEHSETVRSLKVHAETLSQCYRQQISEQEARHNREIIELQSRIEKAPSPVDHLPPVPTIPREEGEGSESVESANNAVVHPVPLERLLGNDSDQEITYTKRQLREQESKVAHLTALLSDTEQDLAKHVQMNQLLKEEIRRQQRSVEREKHAENLEYLKNVVFKFVTLNNGDERSRLVPVLNTILKLSPEETQKLNSVAKGDPGLKGWTSYLPAWSSPTKPQ